MPKLRDTRLSGPSSAQGRLPQSHEYVDQDDRRAASRCEDAR